MTERRTTPSFDGNFVPANNHLQTLFPDEIAVADLLAVW
jgi:hypothetical protein